jgi:hypothetical protein
MAMFLSNFFTSTGMDENPAQYLFTGWHLLYVGLSILVFVCLMKLMIRQSAKTKRIFLLVLGIIMLLLKYGGEALFVWEWVRYGDSVSSFSHPFWDFRTFISFQICGINNVLLPIVIWFNLKPLKDFVYSSSMLGGLAVMLYPVGVLYGDPFVITFPIVRSLVVHFLLVFLPCFMIAIGDFEFDKKRWTYTLTGILATIAFAMFGNLVIDPGANNLYLMENPFLGGPVPLLNSLPSGIHTIFLLSIAFLAFVLLYWIAGQYHRYQRQQRKLSSG